MCSTLHEFYEARHREHDPISLATYIKLVFEDLGNNIRSTERKSEPADLQRVEPWVASLYEYVLAKSSADTDLVKTQALLQYCHRGQEEEFIEAVHQLAIDTPGILQPAACLSAELHTLPILDYCLSHGAQFDKHLHAACHRAATTPEILEIFYNHDWYGMKDKPYTVINSFGPSSFVGQWLQAKWDVIKEERKAAQQTSPKQNKKGPGKHGKQWKRKSEGRDPSKGTGSRDPGTGPSAEQVEKWFGDVPW